MPDKKMDNDISQFCAITGASTRDARRFLEAHKRLDIAIDAFYNNPTAFAGSTASGRRRDPAAPSTTRLGQLFDKYKDPDDADITVDGTIALCQDLGVDPEDVVLLAVAYELKSPSMGRWTRQGWIDGWKAIGTDNIQGMQTALARLRTQLGTDPAYFDKVYTHAFEFARSEGQRSLALETAIALWDLLLPHGIQGGALAPTSNGEDDNMNTIHGWAPDDVQIWFEYLTKKGGKGVSRDTWVMFLDFIRTTDPSFTNYDMEGSWPSTIDDFVEYGRAKQASA